MPCAVDLRRFRVRQGQILEKTVQQEEVETESARIHDDQADMRARQPRIVHQAIGRGDAARRRDDHRNDDQPVDDVAQFEIIFTDHIGGAGTRQNRSERSAHRQNDAVCKQFRHIILGKYPQIVFPVKGFGEIQRIPKEINLRAEGLNEYP